MVDEPLYKRVLLKISGEALMGDKSYGLDLSTVERVCGEIKDLHDAGVQVALVIGGGNIFRGIKGAAQGIERSTSDHMGMLATVMNALAVQSSLENIGLETRVLSAIPMEAICEPYIRRRAVHHMAKGRIVICAAGTGNPYFTTDSAAALRAAELNCEVLMKATKVDGVYTADPMKDPDAKFYEHLSYLQVLTDSLRVMDAAAISLARESSIPVIVFSLLREGSFLDTVKGKGRFTTIDDKINSSKL